MDMATLDLISVFMIFIFPPIYILIVAIWWIYDKLTDGSGGDGWYGWGSSSGSSYGGGSYYVDEAEDFHDRMMTFAKVNYLATVQYNCMYKNKCHY